MCTLRLASFVKPLVSFAVKLLYEGKTVQKHRGADEFIMENDWMVYCRLINAGTWNISQVWRFYLSFKRAPISKPAVYKCSFTGAFTRLLRW